MALLLDGENDDIALLPADLILVVGEPGHDLTATGAMLQHRITKIFATLRARRRSLSRQINAQF
jgi:hypothetical protein